LDGFGDPTRRKQTTSGTFNGCDMFIKLRFPQNVASSEMARLVERRQNHPVSVGTEA
jgi:hypothetical protein